MVWPLAMEMDFFCPLARAPEVEAFESSVGLLRWTLRFCGVRFTRSGLRGPAVHLAIASPSGRRVQLPESRFPWSEGRAVAE